VTAPEATTTQTTPATTTMTVNGTPLTTVGAHTSTLDALRDHGLTGCKEGCAEGECGACAVMVARPDTGSDEGSGAASGTRWVPVNACLIPAAALDGQEIVTAEGLAGTATAPQTTRNATDLHPVQEEMARAGGSQCGYCTPGFICSMAAEYYRPEPEQPFDLHSLSGNLCRCTGYRPIRDAALALGTPTDDDRLAARRQAPAPAAAHTDITAVTPAGDRARYRRPATLDEALDILRDEPDATVVAGATDHGVLVNIRGDRPGNVLAVDRLPELRGNHRTADHIDIGAAQTLSEIERALGREIPLLGQLLPQFASRLIRNSATLGGNLGTGSPIGDTPPALLALEASLLLVSADGEREVALADYFTGYRQSVRRADELIAAVRVPVPVQPVTAFHKIAKRRFDDISSVAVGYAVTLTDGVVEKARIGLGGVAATPLRAYATEQLLEGSAWDSATVARAAATLRAEGTPMSDHRASSAYRTAVLGTSVERFFTETQEAQGTKEEVRS
jgi:xanthine dehydrogenase small subunit